MGGFDRLNEARPAASRFKLVGRGKQRLTRHYVDVDAGLVVIEILAGAGAFGAAFLRHTELFGRQARQPRRSYDSWTLFSSVGVSITDS